MTTTVQEYPSSVYVTVTHPDGWVFGQGFDRPNHYGIQCRSAWLHKGQSGRNVPRDVEDAMIKEAQAVADKHYGVTA